jgi:hypothetical protein
MLCKLTVKRKKSIGGVCGVILEIDCVDILPEVQAVEIAFKTVYFFW